MKKLFSLLLVCILIVGCGNSESEESKLFKKINVDVKGNEAKEEVNGVYTYFTFNTNGCTYSIIKNEENDIVGFKGSNTEKCKDDAVKLIESDAFLNEDGIAAFNKEKASSKVMLIEGYTIKLNNTDAMILKEGKPKTVSDVVRRLKELGMPITDIVQYTEETDENELLGRPNQYIEKINFNDNNAIKSQLKKSGYASKDLEKTYREALNNTVELFKTEEDMNKRYEYLESLNKEGGILSPNQYLYKQDNFLLRISYDVAPKNAKKYEELFYKLFE